MSDNSTAHRNNARRYLNRRKQEGYRAVNVLLPPHLLEALDQLGDGQPRARTVTRLIEQARQEHEARGGGA